jgi:hypothetical protein
MLNTAATAGESGENPELPRNGERAVFTVFAA